MKSKENMLLDLKQLTDKYEHKKKQLDELKSKVHKVKYKYIDKYKLFDVDEVVMIKTDDGCRLGKIHVYGLDEDEDIVYVFSKGMTKKEKHLKKCNQILQDDFDESYPYAIIDIENIGTLRDYIEHIKTEYSNEQIIEYFDIIELITQDEELKNLNVVDYIKDVLK